MKIGINLLYLIPGKVGGTETYGINLIKAISQIDSSNMYYIYINKESLDLPIPNVANINIVHCPIRATSRPLRYFFEQVCLPFLLWKQGIEVVHSLGYVGPLLCPCKSIISIPDTNYYDIRQNFSWLKRFILTLFSTWSARLSDEVITISEFSKSQLHKHVGIPMNKITVTYLGPGWQNQDKYVQNWKDIMVKYSLPQKYIIAFGGAFLHKNIPRLIEAYFSQNSIHDHVLVIMGHLPMDVSIPPPPLLGGGGPRVLSLGYVPMEHIQPLLSHANLFVLPSLYEGFGLPILEAQYAGVPVASSSSASLPEIGGNGAIYFEATSVESIGQAIRVALTLGKVEKSALLKAASINLAKFSWENTASASIELYYKAGKRK